LTSCCGTTQSRDDAANTAPSRMRDVYCPECQGVGQSVSTKTVLHQIRAEELGRVNGGDYRFCADRDCSIVYYDSDGTRFLIGDARELIGAKTGGDGRPICYCFGFIEGDVRSEICEEGASTVAQRITKLIKAGMCECEVRNPVGVCCLGPVMQTEMRLTEELMVTDAALQVCHQT
jgi:hypothetical protein